MTNQQKLDWIGKAKPLPVEMIRESFTLDSLSPSHLRWKERPRHHFKSDRGWKIFNAKFAGNAAGSVFTTRRGNKYFQVGFGGGNYFAHRFVYALAYGVDPGDSLIDHQDRNGLNNTPANLRLSTHTENGQNRGKNKNNSSGKKGVTWCKDHQKWQVNIRINGIKCQIGRFASLDDASAAYDRAALHHFGSFCHLT